MTAMPTDLRSTTKTRNFTMADVGPGRITDRSDRGQGGHPGLRRDHHESGARQVAP